MVCPTGMARKRQVTQRSEAPLFVWIALATGAVYCLGVVLQWAQLNGFAYWTRWEWKWRQLDVVQTALILLAPLALVVWVLWEVEQEGPEIRQRWLWLLVGANFLLQILGIVADPRGLGLIRQIVASEGTTSYFADALTIQNLFQWVRHFHQADLFLHSATHPAGPILFYYAVVKLFGAENGVWIGGCLVGLMGSLGILVLYRFAALWTEDNRARFTACAVYTLLPAPALFFPEFDQAYPAFAMLLILYWVGALTDANAVGNAVRFGAVLAVAVFFAYNILAIGAFLALYTLYWLWLGRGSLSAWMRLLRAGGIAVGLVIAAYGAFWLATGYNPIAAFRRAAGTQAAFGAALYRPYGIHTLTDLYDLFLGAGMVALPVVVYHVYRISRGLDRKATAAAMSLLGLTAILAIDVSGLLRAETARVWLFLQPLLVAPVGVELSRLSWRWRIALLAMQWCVLACLKARMDFVGP